MAIKWTGASLDRLPRKIKKEIGRIDSETAEAFNLLGMESVSHYKRNGKYMDRTRNLRKSSAYGVYVNGRMVYSNYETQQAREALEQYEAPQRGVCLAFVVGAPYAPCVESKGFNVYTSTMRHIKVSGKRIIKSIIKSKR